MCWWPPDGPPVERTAFLALEVQPSPTRARVTTNLALVLGGALIFIALQALQVVVSPIPGEATGILGGYLLQQFGAWAPGVFSAVGLLLSDIEQEKSRAFLRRPQPASRRFRLRPRGQRFGGAARFVWRRLPGQHPTGASDR